ncbi:MAG TPA: diacylglycerol kinase [Pirellulaceae bacterium]|nr:diacylglycerol kinase [Pirellulaceae bacterium]
MPDAYQPPPRSWLRKFAAALAGIVQGMAGQASFLIHLPMAGLVIGAGAFLQVSRHDWCLLLLCIALVLAAELFNSALERLAKAITREENEHLRAGLDMASGAVLMVALGAAAVGLLVLLPHLIAWLP